MNAAELLKSLAFKSRQAKLAMEKEQVVTPTGLHVKGGAHDQKAKIPVEKRKGQEKPAEKKRKAPEDVLSGQEEDAAREATLKAKQDNRLPLGGVASKKQRVPEKGLGKVLELATPLHEDFLMKVANGVHHPEFSIIKAKGKSEEELWDSNFQILLKVR